MGYPALVEMHLGRKGFEQVLKYILRNFDKSEIGPGPVRLPMNQNRSLQTPVGED